MSAAIFEERAEPGLGWALALALLMHLGVFYALTVNFSWKNRPTEAVQAEIWVEPLPRAEPKPLPKPEPAPEVKPEPVIEKPDIAEKKAPEKIKPKPVVKPEPPKPRVDEAQKRMREELQREQTAMALERERQQMHEQSTKDLATKRDRGLAIWMDRIRIQIRNRIRPDVAQAVPGNPEAVFDVTLLPTGEVLNFQKTKSSGHPAYDAELERALSYFKNFPLPRPDRPELFNRELRLTFRPKDL